MIDCRTSALSRDAINLVPKISLSKKGKLFRRWDRREGGEWVVDTERGDNIYIYMGGALDLVQSATEIPI